MTTTATTSDAIETDVEVIFVGSLKSILPQIISRFMAREDARLREAEHGHEGSTKKINLTSTAGK